MRLEKPNTACYSPFFPAFSFRQIVGLGLAGALFISGTVGCKARKDDIGIDMEPIELRPLSINAKQPDALQDVSGQPMYRETPAPLKQPEVSVAPGSAHDVGERGGGRGIGSIGTSFRGADADYIDKADVYWKLNWIRKQLLAGLLPSNLEEAVQKTRRQLLTTKQDKQYLLADAAITHLEKGLKHLRAHRLLQASNAPLTLIPWRAGRDSVQRFIDEGRLGFGGKERSAGWGRRAGDKEDEDDSPLRRYSRSLRASSGAMLSASQRDIVALILEYTEKYHDSPKAMMEQEWRRAIERTNKLRDELGLMNRAQNRDGDSAYIPTTVDQGAAREPMELLRNAVPIPDIHGAEQRKIPVQATIEPKDPFASNQ